MSKRLETSFGMNVEETDITNILLVEIKINVWKLCVFFSREMVWRFKKKIKIAVLFDLAVLF